MSLVQYSYYFTFYILCIAKNRPIEYFYNSYFIFLTKMVIINRNFNTIHIRIVNIQTC